MRRKILYGLGGLVALLLVLSVTAYFTYRHGEPVARTGDADALARRMLAAVDADAWTRTGAVRWTFFNGDRHLWDRTRNLDRFERGDITVWIDLSTRRGVARRGAVLLAGVERDRAVTTAWSRWCNDSFWLNPVPKAFDDGVTRRVVSDDGGRDALLLSYASGGVTPGDRYLWILDGNSRPRAWRMWVSVIPVPGIEASWAGWQRLSTGAWVATEHHMGMITMKLRDVAGAASLSALMPGEDPFAPLVSAR
jgi:hypothetical protein